MLTADAAWFLSLAECVKQGKEVGPRGMGTREILNESVSWDMNYPVIHNKTRKLSYKFMAAEAYWITCGSALVEEIAPYCAHIKKYSDDGYIFNGAYGPMVDSQIMHVVNTLIRDPESRQAVMTIWHPNPSKSKDHKCTIALQFLIRDEQLQMVVTMRSNDLWLGRPYDMFNFTMIALKVACMVGLVNHNGKTYPLTLGNAHLNVGSSHIYEKDMDNVRKVLCKGGAYGHLLKPTNYFFDWSENANKLLECRDGLSDLQNWS